MGSSPIIRLKAPETGLFASSREYPCSGIGTNPPVSWPGTLWSVAGPYNDPGFGPWCEMSGHGYSAR